jgi:hypothetical protein
MGRGRRAAALVLAVLALAGCASRVTGSVLESGQATSQDGDAWVVVTYAVADDDDPTMLQLLPTETAADEALQDAGVGSIDGNEVGQGVYDMYFVGDDAQDMWTVLEPVLAAAPVRWQKVELRDSLEDSDPQVLSP